MHFNPTPRVRYDDETSLIQFDVVKRCDSSSGK